MADTAATISIRGPIEKAEGGGLVLQIPLMIDGHPYGEKLRACSRGIAEVEGDVLVARLPDWLVEKMGFKEGMLVDVTDQDGKFTITIV